MAPALSATPRTYDPVDDPERAVSLQRRALASVDNIASHMEEDDMGLQNQPSLAKDSQEMEQILVDLGSSDIAQADLLQAIKTLESGGDSLSTGDPDGIFPLSGFDLADTADSEGDAAEDKIRLMQARLERRCAFLQRRLRILQARAIGKRISEEAAQTFEKCTRAARKDGGGRPVGLKAFLKKIETTATLQASAASRSVVGPKYYRAGTSKGDATRSASVGIPSGTLTGLEDTAGALRSHLSIVKHELDSDATASSSGAESNDEAVVYNNSQQQHMPIEKRALWSWQKTRASIASRWCWMQAQVQELEYKIRQHNDLHKQVREAKGPVEFEGEPVGYEGNLPGSELPDDDRATATCARVRPLRRETFKKRKLLQMHNLHIATNKAAKPSDIRCACWRRVESCAVCTGRGAPPEPAACDLPPARNLARLDPAHHPVLSDLRDVSPSIHIAALSSRAWFRPRMMRGGRGGHAGSSRAGAGPGPAPGAAPGAGSGPAPGPAPGPGARGHSLITHKTAKRPPTKLKRGRPPLSRKIRDREREDETGTSSHESRRGRPSTESRVRRPSYDIDNIVIPQSIAANTRPQILTYKEIITPKWRLLDIPEVPLNNGIMKSTNRISVESEEEDISEAAVRERHVRAEGRERARYARRQRPRRHTSDVGAPPPDLPPPPPPPTPPAPPSPPTPPTLHETVRPYTPRQFPLTEDTYASMVSAMPPGHAWCDYLHDPNATDDPNVPVEGPESEPRSGSITLSPLSPLSPAAFEGDDPDDIEWNPETEKTERRKSSFR
ncbi:KAT8 regulatory NSL complex subunit 1 [Achroia grisella]|uniref:KAT8 regulatory NSL complex subunit 1 n=1 Tax=Achroia grisella TaxID=688607 RepID=UPI0027D228BC|nr:KAT8 regulatory NSL complex subunit 1 [Achroia grisella]XP_059057305.1 KAT8 regulatory NSL complex subunit 1 [Achroia grisella]XP_059057306.1 KAT8 regulatory NSL complex subunit 1 [Achroia grisella]XP_059057307.1 KAT8 regulatory NSL complex subunit 1 [Achroia grisella]XP_059057308.1 KAT8 regulatory NSL complex subunit 1 [Achroia grisella]